MQHKDGPPTRHLTVHTGGEPPYDPDYDRPAGDRRPPQDLDAERALLAVLIQNPDLGDQLRTEVEPGDFYRPTHEKIWATWHHLHQADGVPPDVVTLNSALIRDRETEAVRELADLATTAASPLHATQYAAIVRDHARLRVVDHVATSLRDVVTRGTVENVAKYLEEAVERIDDAYGRFGARTGHVTPTTWTPVDLTAVLAGEMLDPPPTMLQRTDGVSLFYDGAVHTVAGESESGKTWFCLLAALQLLQAGDDITFLDFEDRADRVIGRLLALGATPDQIQQHFAYVRPDRPLDDDGRAQLAPAITGRRLVIVDGVTEAMTMHGFDLNSNADSALFQGLIPRWIADHGPAVVMIDHVVKDKEKQDRFALGAQHKLAGIDGVAYIVKMLQPFARGHRGVARVEVAKDRPGHVREHARGRTIAEFTLDASVSDLILTADLVPPGHETGRGDDQAWEPTVIMERISRAVQLTPGLSKKALEDITQGKAATKRLALELLVTRGYVLAKQGARGAITHFHVKPFYADGDPTEQTPDDTPTGTTEQTPEGGAA